MATTKKTGAPKPTSPNKQTSPNNPPKSGSADYFPLSKAKPSKASKTPKANNQIFPSI